MDKIQSATLIQSFWRRYQAKKNYGVKQLSKSEMFKDLAYLVGNDPKITGLEPYASSPHEKIALIGASGLRSLALICKVGNKETIPKLIIVDSSQYVVNFWRGIRALVVTGDFQDKKEFLAQFKYFLKQNIELYRNIPDDALFQYNTLPHLEYENQNPELFLERLINDYGFHYLCALIKKATILGQDWTNKTIFASLKNILKQNGINKIYIYPSNIAHCLEADELNAFFDTLQTISPTLSILTDCCLVHHLPKTVILSKESDAEQLKKVAFPNVFAL